MDKKTPINSLIVIPAKDGTQVLVDLTMSDFLETGIRRCKETFFNSQLVSGL